MKEATPAAQVDVLELGAISPGRGRQFWLHAALVSLGVVILLVAGRLAWRWREASAATFTKNEVAQVYSVPISAGPETLDWDPSTRLVEDGGHDVSDPGVVPFECTGIVNPDVPPVSVDLVSVNLTPLVRPDGGQVFSGTVVTYRYADPAGARAKYRAISGIVGRCSAFNDNGIRFKIDQIAPGDDGRARSDLSFRLVGAASAVRISLMRFGNTVTWITTAATVDPAKQDKVSVADLLVDRMQNIYRAR